MLIDGRDITLLSAKELRETRKKIGMIFQHFNLMPSRTIIDNVIYAMKGSGNSHSDMREKAMRLLKLVEIADKANMYPSNLSGGQKQRAAIARAIYKDSGIFIFDEPTANLDQESIGMFQATVKNLACENICIIVTHDISTVGICDKVYTLENGRVSVKL